MVVYFYLSLIFWVRYYHIRNLRTINGLCLLINIMLIIIFVLINLYLFPYFLSVYCNIMFATIKKKRRGKDEN